jgi:prepilin-type processing-associated H-X9-DG protein
MSRDSAVTMAQVPDGTSNTIAVVECAARPLVYRLRVPQPALTNEQGICWADNEGAFSLDGATADGSAEGGPFPMNKRNDNEPFSFHPGGGNVLFADGHVQFIQETIPLMTFAALCTRSAGEVVNATDF